MSAQDGIYQATVARSSRAAASPFNSARSRSTAANSPWTLSAVTSTSSRESLAARSKPAVRFESNLNSTMAVHEACAMIIANGDQGTTPIVWTSDQDPATAAPTVKNANNEWGNLTIMGAPTSRKTRSRATRPMPPRQQLRRHGRPDAGHGVNNNDYGGNNDNDDSGSLSHCAFRYGGRRVDPGQGAQRPVARRHRPQHGHRPHRDPQQHRRRHRDLGWHGQPEVPEHLEHR